MSDELKCSRRQMLLGAMATLAVSSLPVLEAQAQIQVTRWPTQGIGSSDPRFKALLDAHFPGYDSSPALSALLPHTRIFQNITGKHVRALAVDWEIPSKKGATHSHTSHYLSQSRRKLDTRPGFAHAGRALSGRRTVLRAGDYFVITPLFLYSSLAYNMLSKGGHLESLAGQVLSSRRKFAKHLLHTPSGMTSSATIRSMIFPHAQLSTTATDQLDASLQRRFFARSRAEKDEAAFILQLLQQGQKRPEIRNALRTHVQQAIPKPTTGHPRVYAKARQAYARRLLKVIKTHPLPVAQKMLQAIVNVPEMKVNVATVKL